MPAALGQQERAQTQITQQQHQLQQHQQLWHSWSQKQQQQQQPQQQQQQQQQSRQQQRRRLRHQRSLLSTTAGSGLVDAPMEEFGGRYANWQPWSAAASAQQVSYSQSDVTTQPADSQPWDVLYVTVASAPAPNARAAPPNFLGVSHEWDNLWQYNQSPESAMAFANVFRSLGSAPVMRIGGRSQETISEVPGTLTWQTLAQLQRSVNMKFIIGLPLERNDVALARGVMETAKSWLGDSIIAFGLGNEPAMWAGGVGGFDANGRWGRGVGYYLSEFHRLANSLTGCDKVPRSVPAPWIDASDNVLPDLVPTGEPWKQQAAQPLTASGGNVRLQAVSTSSGGNRHLLDKDSAAASATLQARDAAAVPQTVQGERDASQPLANFIGPSWHNVLFYPDALRSMGVAGHCYMREASVHFYSHLGNEPATIESILDEGKLRTSITRFNQLVAVAADAGLGLRVAETNSAVGGGASGVSEVFAAALWTADTSFEFARAGATGVHMHWGVGGSPSGGAPAYVGVQVNFRNGDPFLPYPSVHAPWYGYLLFLDATRGSDVRFTYNTRDASRSTCGPAVKIWSLAGTDESGAHTSRVVVINKYKDRGCAIQVRIVGASRDVPASLAYLKATGGIKSVYGVSWKGQTFAGTVNGVPAGDLDVQSVPPAGVDANAVFWNIRVPAGQAVLLTVAIAG